MTCPNCSDVEMIEQDEAPEATAIGDTVHTCPECGYSETR